MRVVVHRDLYLLFCAKVNYSDVASKFVVFEALRDSYRDMMASLVRVLNFKFL